VGEGRVGKLASPPPAAWEREGLLGVEVPLSPSWGEGDSGGEGRSAIRSRKASASQNSPKNTDNPDPSRSVRFGQQTFVKSIRIDNEGCALLFNEPYDLIFSKLQFNFSIGIPSDFPKMRRFRGLSHINVRTGLVSYIC